mgnify:CR=1 FL=1|jgi:hypothetical protein
MNHSALSIATVLALALGGCASVGVRPASSLPSAAAVATNGHAPAALDPLWSAEAPVSRGLQQTLASESGGSDLWNPAEVARSWEVEPSKPEPRGLFSRAHTDLKF